MTLASERSGKSERIRTGRVEGEGRGEGEKKKGLPGNHSLRYFFWNSCEIRVKNSRVGPSPTPSSPMYLEEVRRLGGGRREKGGRREGEGRRREEEGRGGRRRRKVLL
jgi:hypothetical protein